MMTLAKNLGHVIRLARERKGISRVKLAEFTGISLNALAKYEKAGDKEGKYPAMSKMVKIAEVLEIDPRWVFQMMVRCGDVDLTRDFDFFFFFKEKNDENRNQHMTAQLSGIDHVMGDFYDELKSLRKDISVLTAALKQNGPDQNDPDRPENSTNETEAVDAASNRKPEGD